MSGWSHRFLGIDQYYGELTCLAERQNTVPPEGIEPGTSGFGVQCSTIRPSNSLTVTDFQVCRKLPKNKVSLRMGTPTMCIGENKDADQLRSNCEADQRLCFRYTDSTIPLLSKSKVSILSPSPVTVQPGWCQTWSEPKLLVFSRTGSKCSLL